MVMICFLSMTVAYQNILLVYSADVVNTILIRQTMISCGYTTRLIPCLNIPKILTYIKIMLLSKTKNGDIVLRNSN